MPHVNVQVTKTFHSNTYVTLVATGLHQEQPVCIISCIQNEWFIVEEMFYNDLQQ